MKKTILNNIISFSCSVFFDNNWELGDGNITILNTTKIEDSEVYYIKWSVNINKTNFATVFKNYSVSNDNDNIIELVIQSIQKYRINRLLIFNEIKIQNFV